MADVVIIGAGAAGLFCAEWAVRAGHRVTVLEHMPTAESCLSPARGAVT